MNNRIEAAYEQRPRRWVFELAVALVVVVLLVWSGSAVETAGTTQNGAVIAWNILAGIFHPDTDLLFNFTTQGVPYLLLETICIAFLGTIVGAIICLGMLIYSFFAVDFFIFFFGTSFSLSSIIFSYTDAISSISPNAINFP